MLLASLPGLGLAQELALTSKPLEIVPKQDTEKEMVPLVKVLEEMERRFNIHFNYNSELLEDKMVEKQTHTTQKEFEKALNDLFAPLNLRFEKFKKSENNYLILRKSIPEAIKNLESRRIDGLDKQFMMKKHLSGLRVPATTQKKLFQEVMVTGKVTAREEGSLPGVNVVEKGTTNGTVTDIDGNYSLSTDADATLVFSSVGYETREISVANRSTINLVMEPDIKQLEEIVVVGFGRRSSTSITGAISSMKAEEIEKTSAVTIGDALTGRVPGVITVQETGQPGISDPSIVLRGLGTLNNNDPLIIIDGIPSTLRAFMQLSPSDIQHISVLKDASSTAVYGVRGANGVIIVDTREGEIGRTQISAEVSYGMQTPTYLPDFADSYTWASAYNESFLNDGDSSQLIPQNHLDHYRKQDQPLVFPDNNWIDQFLNNSAMISRNNINVSGGSEDVRYFSSFSYLKQDGLLANFNNNGNTTYDRINITTNLNMNVTPTTRVNFRTGGRIGIRQEPHFFSALYGSSGIATSPPMAASGIIDGRLVLPAHELYRAYSVDNTGPLEAISNGGYQNTKEIRVNLQLDFEQDLDFLTPSLDGLKFRTRIGYRRGHNEEIGLTKAGIPKVSAIFNRDLVNPRSELADSAVVFQYNAIPDIDDYDRGYGNPNRYIYWEAGLDYERSFGQHTLSGLLLYNQNKDYYPNLPFSNIPTGNVGLVGRVVYNYNSQYILEFNLGYNGSENFAREQRFGFFPSASGSWIISKENFMQNVDFIDFLKFRASYGLVGSDQAGGNARFIYIGDQYIRNYRYYYGYNFGVSIPEHLQSVYESSVGNEDVTWETAVKQDYGIDMRLFNNRLSINADYFYEYRDDILMFSETAPGVLAIDLPPINIGEVENSGFELQMSWAQKFGELDFQIGGNITRAKNKILNMDELTPAEPYQRRTGQPIGKRFGYVFDGYYTEEEATTIAEETDSNIDPDQRTFPIPIAANVKAGDVRFQDLNGDGTIDPRDQTVFGYPNQPQVLGGFNVSLGYAGFDLNLGFQGATQVSRNMGGIYYDAFHDQNNRALWLPLYENRWTPDKAANNEDLLFPRLTFQNDSYNRNYSTLWNRDASYLRLKRAELGYNFNENTLNNILGINSMRIFLRGNNLLTWQKDEYRWFDPEKPAINSSSFYPLLRTVFLGASVKF